MVWNPRWTRSESLRVLVQAAAEAAAAAADTETETETEAETGTELRMLGRVRSQETGTRSGCQSSEGETSVKLPTRKHKALWLLLSKIKAGALEAVELITVRWTICCIHVI